VSSSCGVMKKVQQAVRIDMGTLQAASWRGGGREKIQGDEDRSSVVHDASGHTYLAPHSAHEIDTPKPWTNSLSGRVLGGAADLVQHHPGPFAGVRVGSPAVAGSATVTRQEHYGETMMWSSIWLTPGADQATRSASSRSIHDRTVPFRMTSPPLASTVT
jgi:hypothetical protein